MISRRILALAVLFNTLFVASCQVDESATPVECTLAADAVAACGITAPADLMDRCATNPASYSEFLEASCEDIGAAFDTGRADGLFWGKSWGQSCTLNAQCEGDLVCRPIEPYFELHWNINAFQHLWIDQRCLEPGGTNYDICEGNFCDNDDDCADDGQCVGVDPYGTGWEEYVCRTAGGIRPNADQCRRPHVDYSHMRANEDVEEPSNATQPSDVGEPSDVSEPHGIVAASEAPSGCIQAAELEGIYNEPIFGEESFQYSMQDDIVLEATPSTEYDFYLVGRGGKVFPLDYCLDRANNRVVLLREPLRYGDGSNSEFAAVEGEYIWVYFHL